MTNRERFELIRNNLPIQYIIICSGEKGGYIEESSVISVRLLKNRQQYLLIDFYLNKFNYKNIQMEFEDRIDCAEYDRNQTKKTNTYNFLGDTEILRELQSHFNRIFRKHKIDSL